ncbi:MAG: HlyD family efflux transporter periplasmic adaptor subunit, partial [Planctomycetota bacterium]
PARRAHGGAPVIAVLKSPPKPQPEVVEEAAYNEEHFPAMRMVRSSRFARRLAKWLVVLLVFTSLVMLLAPWQQSVRGSGTVAANDPLERPQTVVAPVKGIVYRLGDGVAENAFVKEGDVLFELRNQNIGLLQQLDSQLDNARRQIERAEDQIRELEQQRELAAGVVLDTEIQRGSETESLAAKMTSFDAKIRKAEADVVAAQTSIEAEQANLKFFQIDYGRQQRLAAEGAASGAKFQEAEAKYDVVKQKLRESRAKVASFSEAVTSLQREKEAVFKTGQAKLAELAGKLKQNQAKGKELGVKINETQAKLLAERNKLLDVQGKRDAQRMQTVVAPRDGRIQRLRVFTAASTVKEGDALCQIVPDITQPAVELKVKGNDARWVKVGDSVRLQFEGWPALQFTGYPQVAWGTFAGTVDRVLPSGDAMGNFSVFVVPDESGDEAEWPKQDELRQGNRANAWILLEQVPIGYEIWRQLNGFPPALPEEQAGSLDKPAKPPKPKIGGQMVL